MLEANLVKKQRSEAKNVKMNFDILIVGAIPYNFPSKTIVIKEKFLKSNLRPSLLKRQIFWTFSVHAWGINLGVVEVVKWTSHNSI